ncbi:pilus assembly protein TadG-related protein [Arthrobacter sp. GCM10027362]|uniref:pilus assembly protein TadG-related protein n=1 Tax=Arthrobacter sp. GCM10027362 TaxID=3273379 RepID=UPI0036267B8D
MVRRQRDGTAEDGQVLLLTIGLAALCLLVATVVMAASAVYLEHKKLLSLADSAALAAADTFSLGDVEDASGAPLPALDDAGVRRAARQYLAETGAAERFSRLAVGPDTGSPESRTAHVSLSAVVHPPVVNFLVPAGLPISASSDARSELTR